MLRKTPPRNGLWKVMKEELSKVFPLLQHDLKNYGDFLTGQDETEKQKKVREAHRDLEHKDREKANAAYSQLNWSEKVKAQFEAMKASTRKNAAVVALVQHCTRAHMAEVAVEQGIDVKNVEIVTERASVGQNEKVVGYIEAPNATEEEVMVYAEKLEKSCPAARTHGGIEWRKSPATSSSSVGGKPDHHEDSYETIGNTTIDQSTVAYKKEENDPLVEAERKGLEKLKQQQQQQESSSSRYQPGKSSSTSSASSFSSMKQQQQQDDARVDQGLRFFTGFSSKKSKVTNNDNNNDDTMDFEEKEKVSNKSTEDLTQKKLKELDEQIKAIEKERAEEEVLKRKLEEVKNDDNNDSKK